MVRAVSAVCETARQGGGESESGDENEGGPDEDEDSENEGGDDESRGRAVRARGMTAQGCCLVFERDERAGQCGVAVWGVEGGVNGAR